MRTLAFLPLLAAFFAVATQAIPPATPLEFETLFVGIVEHREFGVIDNSTFGTRTYSPVIGGNFTDCSGKLVATALSGSTDTGVLSVAGPYFPQSVLIMRWEVDQRLAYLRGVGVGDYLTSALVYFHLETDSKTYSALNNRFLVANASSVEGHDRLVAVTIFGAV